jgi:excisionase family DNA binding protein
MPDYIARLTWWQPLAVMLGLGQKPEPVYTHLMPPGYLTVQQVAERLELHESRVKRLIKDGKLKAERLGKRMLIVKEEDLAEFELSRNRKAGRPKGT